MDLGRASRSDAWGLYLFPSELCFVARTHINAPTTTMEHSESPDSLRRKTRQHIGHGFRQFSIDGQGNFEPIHKVISFLGIQDRQAFFNRGTLFPEKIGELVGIEIPDIGNFFIWGEGAVRACAEIGQGKVMDFGGILNQQ